MLHRAPFKFCPALASRFVLVFVTDENICCQFLFLFDVFILDQSNQNFVRLVTRLFH